MRHLIIWISIVAVCMLITSPCMAIFPKPDYYQYYTMRLGWWNDQPAWFISTTTNNVSLSESGFWGQLWNPYFTYPPVLSGRLSKTLNTTPKVARPLYLVTNSNQGPVFDTRPQASDYSGVWQIFLVTWTTGNKRSITNTMPASNNNPYGLPSASEATIVETQIVVDLPVVAIGQLGGPWQPASTGNYRIPQAIDYDATSITKTILLPHYYLFATDPVTKEKINADVLITDVDNQSIANLLGANYAPGLSNMPDDDTQNLWVFNNPKPPSQLPVIEEPLSLTRINTNILYTPMMRLVYLNRNIPAYTVITNPMLLERLLGSGRLTEAAAYKINASVTNVFDTVGAP